MYDCLLQKEMSCFKNLCEKRKTFYSESLQFIKTKKLVEMKESPKKWTAEQHACPIFTLDHNC